jgi:hypothetical protein
VLAQPGLQIRQVGEVEQRLAEGLDALQRQVVANR